MTIGVLRSSVKSRSLSHGGLSTDGVVPTAWVVLGSKGRQKKMFKFKVFPKYLKIIVLAIATVAVLLKIVVQGSTIGGIGLATVAVADAERQIEE